MDMKKRSFKKLITLSLTLAMLTGVAGCGKQQSLNAETNPDTPVSDVQFPLKEKAELSFITSAPATSTQDPNERTIFKRMEKQTNVHIDWTCFVSDQFSDWSSDVCSSDLTSSLTRRIWHWRSLVICRMDCLMQV